MVIVSCSFCGVEFEAKTRRKKWCSYNCNSLSRGSDCTICGKRMHASPEMASNPTCQNCRRLHFEHNYSGFYRGCRCDVCKADKSRHDREYRERRKSEGRPLHNAKPTVEAICASCGVEFQARRDMVRTGGGRFCSIQCVGVSQRGEKFARDEMRRVHERESGKHGSVRWRALRRAKASLELSGGSRVFVNGPCIVCGDEFTAAGVKARYCSTECRDRNSRNNFGIRWLDRMWLYERDDFTCHLCGLRVEYAVDGYDPREATLDHLIPQAHDGSHDFDNLRTAHKLCNSVRRDLPVSMFRSHEAISELRKRLFEAVNRET